MKTFKTLRGNIEYQKHKFLQKYGTIERQAVDEMFEGVKQEYQRLSKQLECIQRDIARQDQIKNYGIPLLRVSDIMSDFYEDDAELADCAVKFSNISYKIDNAMREYLEKQAEVQTQLLEYSTRIKPIKKAFKERDILLLEYNRCRDVYNTLIEKQNEDMSQAEQNLENARSAYQSLNNSLCTQLLEICEHRYHDFQPIYKSFMSSQITLFERISNAYNTLDPPVHPELHYVPVPIVRTSSSDSSHEQINSTLSTSPSIKGTLQLERNDSSQKRSSGVVGSLDMEFLRLEVPFETPGTSVNQSQLEQIRRSVPANLLENPSFLTFLELLLDPQLSLVDSILRTTSIAHAEVVAQSLVEFFDSIEWSHYIVKLGISMEVSYTKSASTLFRANNVVSKLMYHYALSHSVLIYIEHALDTPLQHLSSVSNKPTEIDPTKIDAGNIKDNLDNLLSLAQIFFENIVQAKSYCPPQIKNILYHLRSQVKEKFPENADTAVGGFLFLRLLNPIIVSGRIPSASGDKQQTEIPYTHKRTLLLLSKILQNLSNFVDVFKEEYLKITAPFIQDRFPLMHDFFEQISTPVNIEEEDLGAFTIPVQDSWTPLLKLYERIWHDKDRIAVALSIKDPQLESTFKRVVEDLGSLSSPPIKEKTAPLVKSPSKQFTLPRTLSIGSQIQSEVDLP